MALGREWRLSLGRRCAWEWLCLSEPRVVGLAFDRRGPDLEAADTAPLREELIVCQPVSVRRKRARALSVRAVRQPLSLARAVSPDPLNARSCLAPRVEDSTLPVSGPQRLGVPARELL